MTSLTLTSAVCASHPESQATFSCERCGAFACEGCRGPGEGALCSACAVRTGADRTLDMGEALEGGVRALSKRPGLAITLVGLQVVGAVVLYPLTAGLNERMAEAGDKAGEVFAGALPRMLLGSLLGFVLATFLYGVYIRFEASVAAREERSLGALLRDGVRLFPSMFAVTFLLCVVFAIGFIACVAPALFLVAPLALSLHAVALGGSGPVDALGVSWKLTQGHRLRVLGLTLAVCILGGVLMLLAMGAGLALSDSSQGLLSTALINAASGQFVLFYMGAMGEAYRQLGGAQTQR